MVATLTPAPRLSDQAPAPGRRAAGGTPRSRRILRPLATVLPRGRIALAAVLGLAVAVAAVPAAPARAHDDDLARFLVGATALIIIGSALADKPRKRDHVHRAHRPSPPPAHARRKPPLPAWCLRPVETPRGTRRMFGPRCLERHYPQAHRLPERCLRPGRIHRRWREFYSPRCLRRHGFRTARR